MSEPASPVNDGRVEIRTSLDSVDPRSAGYGCSPARDLDRAVMHGSGDADLTVMIAAHDAFRRDLVSLARAAGSADLSDPARRQAISNGWTIFKRQLPPPLRLLYRAIWPPRYARASRW